ncbi:MAG: hypothetical protein MUC88_00185 [Planctomycetes bacterium]|jgi:hypothetical protein|nr:hypothetical protein [Planctomycetota bacterium]
MTPSEELPQLEESQDPVTAALHRIERRLRGVEANTSALQTSYSQMAQAMGWIAQSILRCPPDCPLRVAWELAQKDLVK